MTKEVQLKHPQGKKAVRMSREKYDLLKPALLKHLRTKGEASFSEITKAVERDFRRKGQTFQGSLPWHLEWVKLDLEARKVIKRVPDTSPQTYVITIRRT